MDRASETPTPDATLARRFGIAVRRLREVRGLSQERLAARAVLNRSYMGEIERAAVMPSLATAAKLAHALELPLWQLMQRCEGERGPDVAAEARRVLPAAGA